MMFRRIFGKRPVPPAPQGPVTDAAFHHDEPVDAIPWVTPRPTIRVVEPASLRRFTIQVQVRCTGQEAYRLRHNLAQHAQTLGLIAKEIDHDAFVSARQHPTDDWFEGRAEIDIEATARNEDNTLAKALHALPRGMGVATMAGLILAEPNMARHPGIIGFAKLLKVARKKRERT